MKNKESMSLGKYLVISGYVLLVIIMLAGLWAIYKNLVEFSEKRIVNENRQELLIVSNIINQLYEVEGGNNLLTYESAKSYIESFSEVKPLVGSRLDSLKMLTADSSRITQLDSIEILLDMKEENLIDVLGLMDSLRKVPAIMRESINTYVPKRLNSDISNYIEDNIIEDIVEVADTDTTVIRSEKKGLLRRLGDAFAGKQDSTVILENRPTRIVQKDFSLIIDTIVNMVRYSERVNLEGQRRFQIALVNRQTEMNNTNQTLTIRVDDLLKLIEKEELEKALRLVEAKESTLAKSYNTVFAVSVISIFIAVVFGLLFILDINRSQRYKKRLEESNRSISKLLKSREKLMLSISHDIKAPMSSILGYIELLESKPNEDSHDIYLNNMKLSGEHVLQLVTNLLDYQKIESDTWTKNEMSFGLRQFAGNTIDSFAPLAQKKKLAYNVNNGLDKNLITFGDPFMMREIFSNIISNAIKYTVEGKIDVSVNYDYSNGVMRLSVRDTGIGISDEDRHLVFEEFEQIKADNIEHYAEGSGLGMAITKGLVDQLGGEIRFESEKGVGTEFIVDIPLSVSEDNNMLEEDMGGIIDDYNIANVSVLLVDDDSIQQTMVSEMLKRQGVKVYSETNPKNVLGILGKQKFDLIFMDIQMPEINGFVLIKQVRESANLKNMNTPVIALTATSKVDLQEYINSGFSGYLNKPFTSKELYEMVSSNVGKVIGIEDKTNDKTSKGIESLISYVKDDKDSSMAILQAFISESKLLNDFLKGDLPVSSSNNASNLAHKMLPLFKMIGDNDISNSLLKLERSNPISDNELKLVMKRIDSYISEAQSLVDNM